jgi:hypothetical protein
MLIITAFLYFWKRIPTRPPSYVVGAKRVSGPITPTGEKGRYGDKVGAGHSKKGSVGGPAAGGRSRHASNSTSISKGTGTGTAATVASSKTSMVIHSGNLLLFIHHLYLTCFIALFSAVVFMAIITVRHRTLILQLFGSPNLRFILPQL